MRPRLPKREGAARQPKDTSWEKVASWYDEHLEGEDDTYQAKVILPNLERILALRGTERVLDLGCGQGFFARQFAPKAQSLVGADLSPSLIAHAKERGLPSGKASGSIAYHVADASDLSFAKDGSFDAVYCVLALQNMEKLSAVMAEVARVLAPLGRFIFVLNHPAFRIPKRSRWGWDAAEKVQFRRTDAYLSSSKERIDMAPGSADSAFTLSFHRSLQDYMKALRGAGFAMTQLEEWISHKKSQPGTRQKAEDRARKEFPLFLCAEAIQRQ